MVDLLKTAKHGRGTNVYLVRFHYLPPATSRAAAGKRQRCKRASRARGSRAPIGSESASSASSSACRKPPRSRSGTHLSLEVRKKRFGYFLDDHHGDGRVALNCKSSPDVRDALQQLAPAQFHVPKYLGNKGWIGLWLDSAGVDWSAVELALREAYTLVVPKTWARGSRFLRDG